MLASGHNISNHGGGVRAGEPPVGGGGRGHWRDRPSTGQAIVAFTIPRGDVEIEGATGDALIKELRNHVAAALGPIAKPRQIMLVPELP